ncbi:LuxR family transcriptional regulator [Streptomyces actinomycinicus]|uniref:LuxR family transcriptional regulator n=1 Tax=Streptomyces actinomycinicus TaxID=1695166 RepID=A0A937EDX8_9ACTN|nr:LuxR family transcriptional regulator [Streptomyces actinomycinicus]MBL1081172.1 LuxR family transcriptional regulator [Streptomyces actinomycinicus]
MSDRPEDELEQALLEVRALIESSVAIHRDRSAQEQLITAVENDYAAVLDTARTLIRGATRSIDIVHARPPSASDRAARPSDRAERELLYAAAEGVGVRLLTIPPLLDEEFVREQFGRHRPVAVRVSRMPPLQALIVDGSAALVVADSSVGRRSSVIRVPEVLHTLRTFFQSVWSDAVPAGETVVFGDRDRAALAQRILGALQAGVTDEVAARELTVSVRTYRRYVAEMMSLLGASSRFQAGVRAAELGLIPAPRPGSAGR